jgi:hypothetical protein
VIMMKNCSRGRSYLIHLIQVGEGEEAGGTAGAGQGHSSSHAVPRDDNKEGRRVGLVYHDINTTNSGPTGYGKSRKTDKVCVQCIDQAPIPRTAISPHANFDAQSVCEGGTEIVRQYFYPRR